MKRVALQNIKRALLSLGLISGLLVSIPVPEAEAANDVQAACVIGSSSLCPAQSPQEIYNLYGTTTNGTYWLNVNGTATQTYLILDTNYPDGGMWFLGMKGTKAGGSFHYGSTNWTSQGTTLNPSSLSNDVTTEAKFDAFNYLPVTKVVAVFKDRNSYNFNSSGSGALGASSFGGHTWKEDISSQTMFSRFTNTQHIVNSTGLTTRYELYRESNSSGANLVFPYMTGFSRYGFNNSTGKQYRWGIAFNNENDEPRFDSADVVSGIGLAANSAAATVTYSDGFTTGINGGTGSNNPGNSEYPSGFQLWGKMAAPSLATPGSLSVSNLGSGSVRLNFAAASGATEYAIQYKTAGANWSSATTYRLTNPGASPSATLTGVASGSYDFRVLSRAANNSSAGNSYLNAQSIDATAPTVTGLSITSSPGSDNWYGRNDVITATATFSENVSVTGSPRIPVAGLSGAFLTYASGSGTSSLTFTYTVTFSNFDSDGISVGANTLELNSGSILDAGLNPANLLHSAINASLATRVDGVQPSVSANPISSSGTTITITASETLAATSTPPSAFTVNVGSSTNSVTSVAISGTTITLNLTYAILAGRTVGYAYSDPGNATSLQDLAGNRVNSHSVATGNMLNNSTATSNSSISLALNPTSQSAIYRVATNIRATVSTPGKVDFYFAGKIISNCRRISTVGSGPITATCAWKPAAHGYLNLSAILRPSSSAFSSANSEILRIFTIKRTGNR